MPRPVHFEIHAADPARAIRFYEAKQAVGEMGWTAYVKDTEGNILGLFQPAAKK